MAIDDVERLKRNNQELQEIINNSWDGIGIIDNSTKLIYVNNAFMPILGFPKEELLKKEFTSLMEEKYIKPFLELLVTEFKQKKYQAEIDIACIRKDKKKVYLKITISSMLNKNLFVINTKDITSQISDDEILNDYVISMHTDLHGHITKVSSAFLKMSLFEENDIVGKHFSSLAHEDTDNVIFTNINKTLENQQEWSGKLKSLKKDGSPLWINLKIKPIYNKYGDVTGYTSLMFDVTNEINLNDEANVLLEQVQTAKNEIEQKNNLLVQQSKLSIMTETLQRLSHEWRQPLNLISIQAQKLEMEYELGTNPDVNETVNTLEKIKEQADNLSSTIETFQNFLKPKTTKALTKVSSILDSAKKLYDSKYEDSSIDIIFDLKDDIEFETYASELSTVFFNLFINSNEAINKNSVNNGYIKVKQFIQNETMVFEIVDNGGGVKEEILHNIFEPYFSTKDQKHGVGLGLYTSKIIINMHLNGIITVNSVDNKTIFKISIPLN